MERRAINRRGENLAPRKINAPLFPCQKQAKAEFSAVILPFSDGEIASDANVSKETVKCWKKQRAFPQGQKLLELAFSNPTVLSWILGKLGVNQLPEFITPEIWQVLMALAYEASFRQGDTADKFREALAKQGPQYRGMNKP